VATSLTTLKANIAGELNRPDLTSEIAAAISTAITYYRSKRFEFNELSASFNTVANQESYTSGDTGFPTDLGQLDTLRITVDGNRTLLKPLSFAELQARSITTTNTGAPTAFAWYGQKLYLNPIPDAVYAVLVSYQRRKAAPTNDADTTSVWTNEAEALIRHCAKKLVRRDKMKDPAYVLCQEAENEALAVLMSESLQLQDDGSPISGGW
jgi:hypothetical protein